MRFSEWLYQQVARQDPIGRLARLPACPRPASPDDVWRHLRDIEADQEMHDALEEASLEWEYVTRGPDR
jgi:hypothetical protein